MYIQIAGMLEQGPQRRRGGYMQKVGQAKRKVLLQLSDIILPSAHIQTKQGYVSGLHLLLSPSRSPSPSSFSFFSLSGRRKKEVVEVQQFERVSLPSLDLSSTVPLVCSRESVCLFLSLTFPPFSQDPLSAHLLSVTSSPLCSASFLWELLEKPAKGNSPGG